MLWIPLAKFIMISHCVCLFADFPHKKPKVKGFFDSVRAKSYKEGVRQLTGSLHTAGRNWTAEAQHPHDGLQEWLEGFVGREICTSEFKLKNKLLVVFSRKYNFATFRKISGVKTIDHPKTKEQVRAEWTKQCFFWPQIQGVRRFHSKSRGVRKVSGGMRGLLENSRGAGEPLGPRTPSLWSTGHFWYDEYFVIFLLSRACTPKAKRNGSTAWSHQTMATNWPFNTSERPHKVGEDVLHGSRWMVPSWNFAIWQDFKNFWSLVNL